MSGNTAQLLFSILRSVIHGNQMNDADKHLVTDDLLKDMIKLASKHDIVHIIALGILNNGLADEETKTQLQQITFRAVYRYEKLNYELKQVCDALEKAEIPFLPLKGSVIRKYYPEAWMRTSCDIDVLVHREDLENTISYLVSNKNYVEKERATHDVSLFTPTGIHVELHFDLAEEGRANNAIGVLQSVWDNVSLHENRNYWYDMSDAYFYFYHIAHMAKHFETGGCGIRPFLDLWILDNLEDIDQSARDSLLTQGGLLQFAQTSRKLSQVWFSDRKSDTLLLQLQNFILYGGAYGTTANRVALQQIKKGGQFGYILSRIFVPFTKLKRYYPILEKHPWLMPFMQIRRWFMLLRPDVMKMAKGEITANRNLEKDRADDMNIFLKSIGL